MAPPVSRTSMPPGNSVGAAHGNGPNLVLPDVLLHFGREFDRNCTAGILDLECVIDLGQVLRLEFHVEHRADDLHDFADIVLRRRGPADLFGCNCCRHVVISRSSVGCHPEHARISPSARLGHPSLRSDDSSSHAAAVCPAGPLPLKRRRAADDLGNLLSDLRLPLAIVGSLQQLENLTRVVGGVLHGGAPSPVLRGRGLDHPAIHHISDIAGQASPGWPEHSVPKYSWLSSLPPSCASASPLPGGTRPAAPASPPPPPEGSAPWWAESAAR